MGFKFRYNQTVKEGQSSVIESHAIDTFDAIWDISPLNSPWANSGCYAGAVPANGSEIGSYSVATWSGWNKDSVYSDMRNLSIRSYSGSAQQNLRFMAKFNSTSYVVDKQSFNWTNLREPTVRVVSDAIEALNNYTEYDPYRRQNKQVTAGGNNNSPLNVAPLTELKINDLVWVPTFRIKEIEYYGYDDVTGGYISVLNPSATTNYTWADVKPEDKTPAGEHYDADLFEKGWTEITPTQEDGRRFRYCCGVELTPYYGLCSNTYNPTTDTYTSGTNPDDGKVYGDRQVFGSVQSQADEYPVIGNTTNLNRPCLLVMTESYDSVTGGLTYTLPAGISFSNIKTSGSISGNAHALQPGWSISSDFHVFAATTSWSSQFFSGNQNYCNFYADVDPSSSNTSPDLSITSTVLNIDIDISSLYDITGFPTSARHYLPNNNPMAFSFARSNRNVTATNIAFYSINSLWHTIASLGCYVADDFTTAQKAPTGYYVGENNHLYLGYMDASGITNGTMLQGKDIKDSTQAKIDDIIQDTPYTPKVPTPGGDGGDGQYPGPSPSGENQPDYKGDSIPGRTGRGNLGNIGASATYYVLSDNLMGNFNDKLWGQPSDFYEALQFTLNATPSIFDYIISCTYYPLNLSGYKGSAQEVYMGTGAKFGLNEYVLNTLSANLDFGSISLTDSVFHPYTDGEAFLNLSPYTQISITLPYAGSYDLNASEVVGGTLSLEGDLSFITGKITYTLTLTTPEGASYPILKHSAKVGCDMKLSGADGSRQAASMVGAGINWAKSLMGAGGSLVSTGKAAAGGDVKGMVSGMADSTNKILDFTQDTANLALAAKEIPLQVGNSDGFDAIFSTQSAFITAYRPKLSNPPNYGHATGYLTEGTSTIGSLSGFTVCRNPDLKGFSAMDEEKAEIQQILTTGFYA